MSLFHKDALMRLDEHATEAVGRVAAGFKWVMELLEKVEKESKEENHQIVIKELKKSLHVLRWVGRAERRIDQSEKKILVDLEELATLLPENLRSKEVELAEKLKITEAQLIELASLFRGELRNEIKEIEKYESLLISIEKTSNEDTKEEVKRKLESLFEKTNDSLQKLRQWIEGTIPLLKSIRGFQKKLKELEVLEIINLSRRRFITETPKAAAGIIAGKKAELLATNFAEMVVSDEDRISAILKACEKLENFCEKMSKQLNHFLIYTPHADYTHFNRVGKWSHTEILAEAKEEKEDWGVRSSSLFQQQRAKAYEAKQPTDQEVSIFERSLVTLANMRGRCRIPGKLFVPKHFPGGPPELELTEVKTVSIPLSYNEFFYLKPFEDLLKLPECKAVMVSHVLYPGVEQAMKEYYALFDDPVQKELESLGFTVEKYNAWVLRRPATLSPVILRGLLRNTLHFKGIIFPDALNMQGILAIKDELLIYFDKNILKTQIEKYLEGATLLNILAIYAGINFFLLGATGDLKYIERFAQTRPYFQKCLEEAFGKYQQIYEIVGRNPPKAPTPAQMIRILIQNTHLPFESRQDAWDRSGTLHRCFRAWYLAALYKNQRLDDQEYAEVFWNLHQRTDWKRLDRLYQQIIQSRYG